MSINVTGKTTAGKEKPLLVDDTGALQVGGVTLGDITVSAITEFAEDTAHSSGALGNIALAVRNDAGTSLSGADGDYSVLQVDSTGALRVTGGAGGGDASAANQTTIIGHIDGVETLLTSIDSSNSRLTSSAGRKTVGAALATTAFQVGGTYNATPPTVADTQEVSLQVDATGNLKVANAAGTALMGKVGIDQTTVGTTNAVSLAQVGATTVATGNGVVGAGVQRVAIASDNTSIPTSETKATLAAATVMQNAVSATANGSTLDVAGYSVATIEVTGTFVGTVTFEASNDDSVWYAISATKIGNNTIATSTTTTGLYRLSVGGIKSIRARVTWTSGTSVTAKGYVTRAEADPKVVNSLLPFTIAGEDIANDVLKVESRYSAANITTQTTTTVKSGAGLLKRIVFNKPLASGVVAVYDNTAGSGTLIATITLPATLLNGPFFLDYEDIVSTGITVVTSGATQDITVIYR